MYKMRQIIHLRMNDERKTREFINIYTTNYVLLIVVVITIVLFYQNFNQNELRRRHRERERENIELNEA
jgi:hypothetical protein